VLCLPLLDDGFFPGRWRARLAPAEGVAAPPRGSGWPIWVLGPFAAGVLTLSIVPYLPGGRLLGHGVGWSATAYRVAHSFRSVNHYGLFAVMTTRRPEIIVEGSADGVTWRPYELRWKPGDVGRRPAFTTPHLPRPDWQMWFAALGDYRENPWFIRFLDRLLTGSPDVLALLEHNPFPDHPPRFVRAVVYDYHFTDPSTRAATGAWWRRQRLGLYCPVLTRRDPEGAEAR
jgi:hypothetical protein